MTIPVNFKSFDDLCPKAKIDFDKKQCSAYFMAKAVSNNAGCYLVKKKISDRTYYKCGYKGKTISNRLDKYNVQDITCLGFIFAENNEKEEFDKDIHKKQEQFYNIKFDGCIFEGSDEEWCHLENYKEDDKTFIDKTKQACFYYRNGTNPELIKKYFWPAREGSQNECIDKAINWWKQPKHNEHFLIGAKCRFGKCYTSISIVKKLEEQKLVNKKLHLIQTYRPSDTIKEWYDTVKYHQDFNYDFYVHPSLLSIFPYAISLDDLNQNSTGFVFASSQLLTRNVSGEYSKYSSLLQRLTYGVELKDEDDVGCNKENSQNFSFYNIRAEKRIRITGTPYEEIINEIDKFNVDNTYIWDYIDEQKAKEFYKKLGTLNPYKDMAKIRLFQIDLAKNIYAKAQKENPNDFPDEGFTLTEFQRVEENDKLKFKHHLQVKDFWLKTLSIKYCDEDEEEYSIFNGSDVYHIKHALVKVPCTTIDATANLLKTILEEHKSLAERFKVIKITGDCPDVKSNEELKQEIEKADLEDKIAICLTVYKDCRGVGIGLWNTVIHLSGTEESYINTYEQTNFRGQTPYNGKEYAYVFDYAPNRILRMAEETALIRAKTHHLNYEETIKEVLNYYPVFKLCNNKWTELDYSKVITELREIRDEKKIENNVISNSPLGFIEKQSEEKFKMELNNTKFLAKLKYKGEKPKNKSKQLLSTEEFKKIQEKLYNKFIKKQQKNFFIFFKKTLKFVWVKNNGLPFDSNVYHKLIYNKEVQEWISNVYEVSENFYSLLEEAFSNNAWLVSVDEFLKLTYDNKKFDEICPTVISKINSDYKTPNNLVSNCWGKVKVNEINNFVEICSKCGEFAKFGIENYKLKKENCYFVARSSWCAALTSLNIYNDYDYTKYNTIKIVNIDNSDINNKLNLKEMFDMKHLDLLLGNPPYGIKVEEGRKRSLDLDLPIWDELKEQSPNTEIHLLMKSTHSHKNGHGFTDVEDKGKFEGVSQDVSLYSSVPNEPELKFDVSKHNDKHNWINDNDKSNTNHSLNQMINHKFEANHPNTQIVPNDYIVLSQVCTRNFKIWLPGESLIKTNGKIHTMKVFIPTNKPNELKNYLINVVQPKHNEFRKKYKDQNIDRGFAKTVEIPSEYWVKDEFVQ